MADPALIKIAVEAAIQVAKDEESRKRLPLDSDCFYSLSGYQSPVYVDRVAGRG